MNTPVNFEIAKLLKEKGFDAPCMSRYYEHGDNELAFIGKLRSGMWFTDSNYNNVKVQMPSGGVYCPFISAPTIAEVVMWSFNTHKIWITVDVNINGKFNYLLRQFNSKDRAWEVKNPSSIQEYFNNPDDAYSSGITYFLNNLEMSK